MASIKEISLPHGTIPTQMFGNVNLQNAVMYVNENFAAVKEGVNDAVAATNEAIAEKADGDHDHDDAYSALGHMHSQSEVIGLSSALDGKADLNHEHSQYLSSLPAHYHDVTGIQGLGEQLQAKAEKTHSHTMAQVENLSTELGVKASTAYVDQQVNAVGTSIKAIADQEIIDCGAAKEGTSGAASTDVPKDVTIAPSNETVAQKNARVGTANRWARADHKHVFETETDAQQISKLKHDGNGTDGAASFGTAEIVPRIDHSHPLNFPDDKPVNVMSKDGMGEGGTASFGKTNYYADLGHSHPLNVASSGTPSDVVKSTGTASSGSSEYYARQDHIHKMPTLDSNDISVASSVVTGTITAVLDDHEGRIEDLEKGGGGGGTVTSVDSVGPTAGTTNIALNALRNDDGHTAGTKAGSAAYLNVGETDGVQAYSEKLDGLDALLNDDGTIPSTAVVDEECTSGGDCLAYFDADKSLAHLGNSGITVSKANAMNDCFDYASTSGKVTSGKLNCKAAGSSTAPTSAKVIGFEANTSSASLMDAAIVDTSVSATDGTNVALKDGKLVKDTNTYLKVDSSVGLVHSNSGVISYVGIGAGSDQVAAGNHVHTASQVSDLGTAATCDASDFAPSSTVSFPGYGGSGSATTTSRSDHNHDTSYVKGNGTAGTAAYKNVGSEGGVQEYSSKLANVQANIDSNGKVLLSGIQGDISGHTGSCLVTIDNSGSLGHSGNKAYTLVDDASEATKDANKIITDKDIGNGIEADSTTHNLKVKCAENSGLSVDSNGIKATAGTNITVDSSGISVANVSGTGFVRSNNGTLEIPADQPLTLPSGSGFLKSSGTTVSAQEKVSESEINFGTGVTNITTSNISSNAVTSVNGGSGAVTIEPFPGFGTTKDTAAKGNHTHTASQVTDLGTAATMDVGEAGGVQEYSSILTHIVSGGHFDSSGKIEITAGSYVSSISDKARIVGVNANSTSTTLKDSIGADMVAITSSAKLDSILDDSGNVKIGNVKSFSTGAWVKTDNSGNLTTTTDNPIVASTASSGVVYNTTGTISYKAIGTTDGDIAAGDHSHAYGSDRLTGFGTAAAKNVDYFAEANHTHTASQVTDLGTAATHSADDFAPSTTVSFPGFDGTGTATKASHSDHAHGKITNGGALVDGQIDTANKIVVTDGSKNITYDANLSRNNLSAIQSAATVGNSGGQTPAYYATGISLKSDSSNVNASLDATTSKLTLGSSNAAVTVSNNGSGTAVIDGPVGGVVIKSQNSGIWLNAPANNTILTNSPTDSTSQTTSKHVATCGWVCSNFQPASGLTASKWVKTDGDGKIGTTTETPVVASTTLSGVMYNTNGTISYKAINGANGVAGTDANNKIKLAQIPTGTSASSVALGNHTHAYGDGSLSGFGTAAAKNVGATANDVAAGSHVHGNITADGRLNGCSSADCFLVTTTNAVIAHSNLAPKVSDVKDLVTQWISADKKLGAVASVCGKTGAVTLKNSDVGAAATNHNHTTGDITNFSSSVESLINSALTSYATQSWVTSKLSDKASQSSVDTLTDSLGSLTAIVQQISSDYVTSTELASYATQEWVQSQGYVTDEELGECLTTEDISQASINALASGVSSSTLKVVGEVTWNGSDLQYKYKEVTITKGVITNVPASYTTEKIDTPTVITWS